jgi:hypothetical protein
MITTLLAIAIGQATNAFAYTSNRTFGPPPLLDLMKPGHFWEAKAVAGEVADTTTWCLNPYANNELTRSSDMDLIEHYTSKGKRLMCLSPFQVGARYQWREAYQQMYDGGSYGPILETGSRYLVWGDPFDGKSDKGTFLQSSERTIKHELPRRLLNADTLIYTRYRMKVHSNRQISSIKDIMLNAADGLLQPGMEGAASADFLKEIELCAFDKRSMSPEHIDLCRWLITDFPRVLLRLREQVNSPISKLALTYHAYRFGGETYAQEFLRQLSGVNVESVKDIYNTALCGLVTESEPERLPTSSIAINLKLLDASQIISINSDFAPTYKMFAATSSNFFKAKLLRFIDKPQTKSDEENWIRLLLKQSDKGIQTEMISKCAQWLGTRDFVDENNPLPVVLERYRRNYSHLLKDGG